jgi:dihydrofolate reductase
MSKLILWNLLTLDGFFEGINRWELEWHRYALGEEFDRFALEQLRSADKLLFGRVTYEGMAAFWPSADGEIARLMNSLPKVVFSRSLTSVGWAQTTLVKDDAAAAVAKLKREGTRNLLVFGSATLSASLMDAALFDEYRFGITPIILGRGRPFFHERMHRLGLRLLESRVLSSGCVILRYEPVPAL